MKPFEIARHALEETILLTLARGPQKIRPLLVAVQPFGHCALQKALVRLVAAGEIAAEGQTQARIYRLVQRTAAPVCYGGEEFERIWPIPGDPKAAVSALVDQERAR